MIVHQWCRFNVVVLVFDSNNHLLVMRSPYKSHNLEFFFGLETFLMGRKFTNGSDMWSLSVLLIDYAEITNFKYCSWLGLKMVPKLCPHNMQY